MSREELLTFEMQVAHDAVVAYTSQPQACSDLEYYAELRRLTEAVREVRARIEAWKRLSRLPA